MKRILALFLLTILFAQFNMLQAVASTPQEELTVRNQFVLKAIDNVIKGDLAKAKESYDTYNKEWLAKEEGVKKQSKQAYGDIESKMGMVQFFFSQNPVQPEKVLQALRDLETANQKFIDGKYDKQDVVTNKAVTINDLLVLLEKANKQIKEGDISAATKTMDSFTSSWLEVEGTVLTKSQKIYNDAEKDMVSARAYLTVNPAQPERASNIINRMIGYLYQINGETSYSMLDAITIILREGLEALLVVIALLAFLKKSGHEDKKGWIYGGIGVGLLVSVVLAVVVKLLFASGTFGSNNFLIAGWTGVFAALMLVYVSYWLHSKSNVSEWQNYIKSKGTKAIATGSLFSLAVLAFLAVFREGTETVLFFIGMASSISLFDLLAGIGLGSAILIILAYLILKVGLRIPMKPFFQVSSLLVFYLAIKFTGMGINGLQLAGLLPATTSDKLPSISWLAVYPSWENLVPQVILIIGALTILIRERLKTKPNF